MSRPRKFQVGDEVKVTKDGRYGGRLGTLGVVVAYRLRVYGGIVGGSRYLVAFEGGGCIWVETEYLSKAA